MNSQKRRKTIFRILIGMLLAVLAGALFAATVVTGYALALLKNEPVRERAFIFDQMNNNAMTSFVYFNDGTLIGQLRTDEDRRMASLNEVPDYLLDAVIAIEDNHFYDHIGVDMTATARALLQKALNREVQTGGSTITQQLARRVFLSLEKSTSRKVKEIVLALRIERMMSKDQIMTAYLNKIPFGQGASGYNLYGIKAAAKGLFGHDDLQKLSLAQAAYLAGLPQQPSNFSAFTSKGEFNEANFARAIARQQLVLKRMLAEGMIEQQQYDEALTFDVRKSLAPPEKKAYTTYPFLMIETEKKAAEVLVLQNNPQMTTVELRKPENAELIKSAQEQILRSGYRIHTTIDKSVYDLMQQIAKNPKNFTPDSKTKGIEQIGAIMLDNRTGAIVGMMEGRDFYKEQLNHATQAIRQPGSTMKPIAAFLPALEQGLIQPASVIDDVPLLLENGREGVHIPENHDRKFHGLITARHALNQSYNIPALKIFLNMVGIENAWDFARKLGITTLVEQDKYAQTGVLGGLTNGVTLEELTNAYSTAGNQGMFNDAFLIDKIETADGEVLYQHKTVPRRMFSEETAFLMTDMLRTVVTEGTGGSIKRDFKYYNRVPIVGKTGSTQDDADAWFIGYSPDVTLGVWAGYDQPKFKLTRGSGTQRAKKIWAQVMNETYEQRRELFIGKQFVQPENVVKSAVSRLSGKLPNEHVLEDGYVVSDWFNKSYLPTEQDRTYLPVKTITHKDATYLANEQTPADLVDQSAYVRRAESLTPLFDKLRALGKMNERYYPLDMKLMAPSKTDPRLDDGSAPAPATALRWKEAGVQIQIEFEPSTSPDVVGYRLYRSDINPLDFKQVGNSLLVGMPTIITDPNPYREGPAVYTVATVDVVGKESMSSELTIGGD